MDIQPLILNVVSAQMTFNAYLLQCKKASKTYIFTCLCSMKVFNVYVTFNNSLLRVLNRRD